MLIEIKSKNFINNQTATSLIIEIITRAVDDFLDNKMSIDKIVVSDEENHGAEIEKIQIEYKKTIGYTNSNENLAIAKSITSSDKNCSVVFLDYIFAGILVERTKSNNLDEWDPNAQLYYYVIFHELAHCYDDISRIAIYSTQQFKRSKFSKEQIKKHYICTILSEFAASVLPNRMMAQNAFISETKKTVDECDNQLVALEKQKSHFFNNQVEVVDIAYQASQTFWFILTQFSKLIGNNINIERGFSFEQIFELPRSQINITPTILVLENALKKLWEHYPTWSPDLVEPLNVIWNNLAIENGFVFNGDDEQSLIIQKA